MSVWRIKTKDFQEEIVEKDISNCVYCGEKTSEIYDTNRGKTIHICADCYELEHTETYEWYTDLLYFVGDIALFIILFAITRNI